MGKKKPTREGSMFDYYLALRNPEQSGLLAWSALPHAPVLSTQRPEARWPAAPCTAGVGRPGQAARPAGWRPRAKPGCKPRWAPTY